MKDDAVMSSEKSVPPPADLEQMDNTQLLDLYKETGDQTVKWELALRYENLVKYVALQVRGIYSEFAQVEDIINEGLITVLKAIDKFDPAQGVKFETFVSKRIRGMVIDLARKQDWVPRNVRKRAKEIDTATMELANKLGRYPTSEEMADYLEVPEERYQKDLACIAMNNVISLEALMDAGESENPRFEVASKDTSSMPDEVLEEQEHTQVLEKAIRELQENEQIVLSLYYVESLRLKDIAHIMNVSEPRVSQIHTRAISKLRNEMMKYYNISGKETATKRGKKD